MPTTLGWTIADWQQAYREGARPEDLLAPLIGELHEDDPAWIARLPTSELSATLSELADKLSAVGGDLEQLPLYGVPFAAKDNIDAEGFDTTAACPAYAYTPEWDAAAIRKLKAAGAVVVGKTNLDQFATGLVGTRSPYGAVPNSFKPEVISGGSSSGSASVVAVAWCRLPWAPTPPVPAACRRA